MLPDQDWPSVWPAARTFHPASVPLPLRQGVIQQKKLLPPEKYANTELMKIPNFLHLTPPAINRHCEAIKKFCTPWPKGIILYYCSWIMNISTFVFGTGFQECILHCIIFVSFCRIRK